jgi:hypothetical protein
LVTTRLALSLPGRVLAGLTASQLASKSVCKLGLEGIVSKKLDAPYRSGPVENLDQDQKSESTGSDKSHILTGRVRLVYFIGNSRNMLHVGNAVRQWLRVCHL